jgi:hypothetical protein
MVKTPAWRPWPAALAAVLACALLVFTTVYRNSSGFSPATAARCHSLSADHTSARALFVGDFGPLTAVLHTVLTPARPAGPVRLVPAPRPAPARPVALLSLPFRRPPPAGLV